MFDLYSLTICNGLTPFDNERELLIARDTLLVFTLQSADEAAELTMKQMCCCLFSVKSSICNVISSAICRPMYDPETRQFIAFIYVFNKYTI